MTSPSPLLDTNYHSHVRSEVLPFIPRHGGTLLDLGGGVGATALAAKDLGVAQKVGVIDLVDPLAGLDFNYRGDLNNLEFLAKVGHEQGAFRTILCLDILEHLVDPWAVVGQLHKMLEPGGVIVASIPNVRHISVVAPLLLKSSWQLQDEGVLDRTHLRFFTESSAVDLMVQSGMQLELTKPLYDGGKATKLFGWMPLALMRDFAALQYLVRVRNGAASATVA
jgi:2-polyprenyl-3-methyl-5-hydroxy-6-metoxy-1,4-benzoquinol methylase